MRLLVITQMVDREDATLGFFHNWLSKLAVNFEKVTVICLKKGTYDLPENVEVFSLDKESSVPRTSYLVTRFKHLFNFFRFSFFSFLKYDAVFVHMNQEYVLLGGLLWKILGKKIYMWRNHPVGSFLTRIAVLLCDKVFCTSEYSYTAKFKKTRIMPVGIEIERFKDLKMERLRRSILFLGRMSPIKKPDLLIEALNILNKKGLDFVCNIYGDPLPKDAKFYESLKKRISELGIQSKANFHRGVPNYETPKVYNEHDIFVNLTPSGSFDKTILEAAACGCLLIIANKSLSGKIDKDMIVEESADSIAEKIELWLGAGEGKKEEASSALWRYVEENHSLATLTKKLQMEIK